MNIMITMYDLYVTRSGTSSQGRISCRTYWRRHVLQHSLLEAWKNEKNRENYM